jgi:hypothetical protein
LAVAAEPVTGTRAGVVLADMVAVEIPYQINQVFLV